MATKRRRPISQPVARRLSSPPVPRRPTLGPPDEQERSAAAFWYRRLATTLALANGAGILAIGGYVSNSKDIGSLEGVSYLALTHFLAGALFASASFVVSLLWVSFRVDAYFLFLQDLVERKYKLSKSETYTQNWIGFSALFALIIQLTLFSYSSIHFYEGSYTVVEALRTSACKTGSISRNCSNEASFLFPHRNEEDSEPPIQPSILTADLFSPDELGEDFLIYRTPNFVVHVDIQSIGGDDSSLMYAPRRVYINNTNGLSVKIEYKNQYYRVAMFDGEGDDLYCTAELIDFFIGDSGVISRNPAYDRFFALNGTRRGDYTISILPELSQISIEDGPDIELPSWPGEMIKVRTTSPPKYAALIFPFPEVSGGVLMSTWTEADTEGCARLEQILMLR